MSAEAMVWASEQQLPPEQKLLLIGIANQAPSQQIVPDEDMIWVREFTGLSESDFDAALEELVLSHYVRKGYGGYVLPAAK